VSYSDLKQIFIRDHEHVVLGIYGQFAETWIRSLINRRGAFQDNRRSVRLTARLRARIDASRPNDQSRQMIYEKLAHRLNPSKKNTEPELICREEVANFE
jgi:hypothetical protein